MPIFDRLSTATMLHDPFPHIILENAIDPHLADRLLQTIPPLERILDGKPAGSNQRCNYNSPRILADDTIDDCWKQIVHETTSQGFLKQILGLFGAYIPTEIPEFVNRFGPIDQLDAKNRHLGKGPRNVVGMDCQIAVNTPALTPGTTVRGPHLDNTDKLYICLLYLRHPQDDSTGASLELYQPVTPGLKYVKGVVTPFSDMVLKKTIPYQHNTLVLFLNSDHAWHGVSLRSAATFPRYHVNIVSEMCHSVYEPLPEPVPAATPKSRWWKKLFGSRS